MSDYFQEFFNDGDDPPKNEKANNFNTFDLTKEEVAFVNAINFHISDIKDLICNVLLSLQRDFELKEESLKQIKKKFIKYAASKRGLDPSHKFTLDQQNQLLVMHMDKKD